MIHPEIRSLVVNFMKEDMTPERAELAMTAIEKVFEIMSYSGERDLSSFERLSFIAAAMTSIETGRRLALDADLKRQFLRAVPPLPEA